jgi:pimeloyl-ACP methyl ester carboxylesterase
MTVVLVHGNPETDAIWGPLVDVLGRDDVMRLSPPAFGAPLANGFPATYLAYRDWLEDELEAIDEPVDLVGHDWGGGHVVNVVMHRPELVRSWASDVLGLFDPDYVWHDLARGWQTPGDGEQLVETMLGGTVQDRATQMAALGIPMDIATPIAAAQGPEMGRAILSRVVSLGAPTHDGRGWPRWKTPRLGRAYRCWPPKTPTSAPSKSGIVRPTEPALALKCLKGWDTGGLCRSPLAELQHSPVSGKRWARWPC